MIAGTGTGNIIEEKMEGRRVARARLGRGGSWFVQDGGRGGVKEMVVVVLVVESTREGRREGLVGKREERRRLYENLSLHWGDLRKSGILAGMREPTW